MPHYILSMYCLFVDLDGVLVDFETGVDAATGLSPNEQSPRAMWTVLARTLGFYENLDWLTDGRKLWTQVRPLEPTILTGLPLGRWAEPQKRAWCTRELGERVPVITCMSREKAARAQAASPADVVPVLIDDRGFLKANFERAGGIFIHYSDPESAMAHLNALGDRFVPAIK